MRYELERQGQFLVRHNIVTQPQCGECNATCTAVHLTGARDLKRAKGVCYVWRCPNQNCSDQAFTTGSYLHKLSIFRHIQLLYKFYIKSNAKQAAQETGVHVDTVRRYFAWYRHCISEYMQNHFYPHFHFDVGYAIEYDEANLGRRSKYGRGTNETVPIWVLGGVSRGDDGFVSLNVVDDRTRPTLHGLIQSVCPRDSEIITDCWRAYFGLDTLGYYHWTVNHSLAFVDPYTGQHTNTIEGLWSLIRADLRNMRGINHTFLQHHLDVFAFRRNLKNEANGLWATMCLVIGQMQHSVTLPSI